MAAVGGSAEAVVVDASVFVDLLGNLGPAAAARERLRDTAMHAPAHMDAEVLSALGRLSRAGEIAEQEVPATLGRLAAVPIARHAVSGLVVGAWRLRGSLRLADALYAHLAYRLDAPLLTTDLRLARACGAAEPIPS